jgi:glucosyl-dolichyl phosphate glucuronosyltransferase
MDISIIICTFNRSGLLDKTLDQLRSLDATACVNWELLVVNNNCSDDTDGVIRRHCGNLPVRRLWEPRTGKSYAANLAVREAKGDLLLWTDDDVLVDPGWLRAYVEAADAHPDAGFFGGPITPWFESEPPQWITRNLPTIDYCFAIREVFGEPYTPITADYRPYGANMAIRRDCFSKHSFDTRLGPQADTEIRGEETALILNWLADGLTGLWVPEARVRHFIPNARLSERFIWNFHYGYGRTVVRRENAAPVRKIFGMPRWAVRQYLENLALSKLLSHQKDERWLRSMTKAAFCRGILKESRERRDSGPNQS